MTCHAVHATRVRFRWLSRPKRREFRSALLASMAIVAVAGLLATGCKPRTSRSKPAASGPTAKAQAQTAWLHYWHDQVGVTDSAQLSRIRTVDSVQSAQYRMLARDLGNRRTRLKIGLSESQLAPTPEQAALRQKQLNALRDTVIMDAAILEAQGMKHWLQLDSLLTPAQLNARAQLLRDTTQVLTIPKLASPSLPGSDSR